MPEKQVKWFKLVGDCILFPAGIATPRQWKSRRFISPVSRNISEVEIWTKAAVDFYNGQPIWNLDQLTVNTAAQARMALTEFLRMAQIASEFFCWWIADPDEWVHWKRHGWKHICWSDIQDVWQWREDDHPLHRAQAFGTDEIRRLFQDASNGDPEAVGRVWGLFKHSSEHDQIMNEVFTKEERPNDVPAPASVAEKLVNSIFSAPHSKKAVLARRNINRLVSISASKGIAMKKGRPRITVPPATLRSMLKMARCQAVQVRQVVNFLEKNQFTEADRLSILKATYPWIETVAHMSISEFIRLNPSRAAGQIVSKVSGVSCSALEKLGISPSFRKNDRK